MDLDSGSFPGIVTTLSLQLRAGEYSTSEECSGVPGYLLSLPLQLWSTGYLVSLPRKLKLSPSWYLEGALKQMPPRLPLDRILEQMPPSQPLEGTLKGLPLLWSLEEPFPRWSHRSPKFSCCLMQRCSAVKR